MVPENTIWEHTRFMQTINITH